MSKKLILIFVVGFFFFGFNPALAEVVINEIGWKGTPTGSTHEWLELANTGSLVDLSGWIIKDGENQLNIVLPDGATISSGGFYVVKRTTSDIVPYDFSTAFNGGLSDAGEKLILSDVAGTIKQTLDFSKGWPDSSLTSENTMQWNGSSWATAAPTPKTQNQNPTPPPSAPVGTGGLVSGSDNNSSASAVNAETKTKNTETPKIKTQITSKTLGFAGLPITFEGKAFGLQNEPLHFGKYFWNFGDGDSKETQASDNQKFSHIYFYPGDYAVSLDYYQNYYSDIPDASAKIAVKIIPASILISGVGDEKDFFVELQNNTDYDADISNWVLVSETKSFTIPRNTILISKKTIMISPHITHFSILDKNTLKLMTPEREVVFDYPASEYPEVLPQGELENASVPSRIRTASQEENNLAEDSEIKILPESLPALAFQNDMDAEGSNNSRTIVPIISLVFIGACAYAVYFIRQKKIIPQAGSDFEILDE